MELNYRARISIRRRLQSKMRKGCAGEMVLEMAILFPVLFLLWMGLLYVLIEIAEKGMTEAICNQSVMMCRELERGDMQSAVEKLAQQYCSGSGLPIRFVRAEVSVQEEVFHTRITVSLETENLLWRHKSFYTAHTAYRTGNADLRNRMDLIWEAGEKLPIVGDVLRKYQEELARIKEQLSE